MLIGRDVGRTSSLSATEYSSIAPSNVSSRLCSSLGPAAAPPAPPLPGHTRHAHQTSHHSHAFAPHLVQQPAPLDALGRGLTHLHRAWALGIGHWALGIGHWAVGSGQWAVGSGQWAVGSGQWAAGSGQWAVGSGQ